MRDIAIGALAACVGIVLVFTAGAPALVLAALIIGILSVVAHWRVMSQIGRRFERLAFWSLASRLLIGPFLWSLTDRTTDATAYYLNARANALGPASGVMYHSNSVPGTGSVDRLSIVLYRLGITTEVAQALVYSALGWLGLTLAASAIVRWVEPDLFRRSDVTSRGCRWAILAVLFLPSSLVWPSAIGKDALMALAIGLTMYGVTRYAVGSPGRAAIISGSLIGLLVRPHVQLLLLIAVGIGFIARVSYRRKRILLPLLMIVVLLPVAIPYVQHGLNADTAGDAIVAVQDRSSIGGSRFTPVPLASAFGLVAVPITVMFRPFPQEADTALALYSSLESVGLLLLAAWLVLTRRGRRLTNRDALGRTAIWYALGFFVMFGTISNFGLLARQRIQLLPMVMAYLAVTLSTRTRSPVLGPASEQRPAQSEHAAEK